MKKLLLFTMLFVLSFSYAQEKTEKSSIKKGTWNLGGTTSFTLNTNEADNHSYESDYYSFNFSPKIGYTISDNLILGIGVGYGYGYSKTNNTSNISFKNKNYAVEIFPYIRKHFSVGKKLTLSLQGEFKYSYLKHKTEQNNFLNNTSKSNIYTIGIRPGITYFLNKKLALEANLGFFGYTRTNIRSDNNKQNNSRLNFNLNSSNLMFGLSYYWL